MPDFVDRVVLHITAGNGGNGCASVHREKFKPLGGPDGGNGGRGGDVIAEVDPNTSTLLEYHKRPHRRAGNGRQGQGANRNGADADDIVLLVPDGTMVRGADGEVIADLVGAGTRLVVAQGGRGGLGNAALATPKRKAPGFALKGEPGEALDAVFEMKSVADVGLVGFPSAGKSSLIAALSAAKPKIADYPFTTLIPNLGVVEAGDTEFVVADVPGLIPGASEGRGLGLEFLRHVERCSTIVHVLDCATPETGRDPVSDLDAIEAELAAYETDLPAPPSEPGEASPGGLAGRPRIVVLNKVDVPEARELAELVRPMLAERGLTVAGGDNPVTVAGGDNPVTVAGGDNPTEVYEVSAATHEGLRELAFALARLVGAARDAAPPAEPTRVVLRPKQIGESGFTVRRRGDGAFSVRGAKPERWVRQTDFGNEEAVGYLADRLARLGVENELVKAGAEPGVTVMIGDESDAVVFDWYPSTPGGEYLAGPRGTDRRLGAAGAGDADEQ